MYSIMHTVRDIFVFINNTIEIRSSGLINLLIFSIDHSMSVR